MAFEKETRKSRGPAKTGSRGGAAKGTGGGKKTFGDKSKPAFGDKSRSAAPSGDRPKRSYSRDGAPPKRDFGDRPPRKDFSDRPPRREGSSEDRPKRSYSRDGAPPKRDFGDRPPRRDSSSEDRPRRSFDDRPKRDFGDRSPRKDFGDRPPRREGSSEDRPKRAYTSDRAPRREGSSEDRPPRRDYSRAGDAPRAPRKDFGDRPPRRDSGSEDRPRRAYSEDRPKRDSSFSRDGARGDRPARKEYAPKRDDDFKPSAREGFEKRPAKEKSEPIKGHELLLYGVHAVHAALRNTARKVSQIWVTESGQDRLMEAWDKERHPHPEMLERRDLDNRLTAGAVHQGMAIAVEPLQDVFLTDIMTATQAPHAERHIVVILDEVTDPHNVGAVLRSMSAFGAKAMIVHKRNAPGITGVMAKIATGAVENIPMVAVTNISQAMTELKNAGFFMLGLDENADYPIQNAPKDGHVALVLGAEGEGLRALTRSTCDAIASIETFGDIKSLNVSNAAAIGLFSLTQKQE